MSTGTVASGFGSSIGYVINADGSFRYAALLKSTLYGCSPSSKKEQNKPLKAKSYNFEVGTKDGKELLLLREVGKTRPEDILIFPRSKD